MDKLLNSASVTASAEPILQRVSRDRPFHWLSMGARDFMKAPVPGLIYGLMVVLLGYAILWGVRAEPFLVLTFLAGFLLLGPLAAMGIYESSRLLEQGRSVSFMQTWRAWRDNPVVIGLYIAFLSVIMIAWIRFTSLMLALFFDRLPAGLQTSWSSLFSTVEGLGFLGIFMTSGALAAVLVFMTGVVTLPMITDRRGEIIDGVVTSVRVVLQNPAAMAIWAGLLAALTAFGFATLMLGLMVILPILGHATWHAYRELVHW